MYGPRHPGQPVGEAKTLSPSVMCHTYEDGRLYQISSPRGRSVLAVIMGLRVVPEKDMDKGTICRVHDPMDYPDYDGEDENVYFAFWVSTN